MTWSIPISNAWEIIDDYSYKSILSRFYIYKLTNETKIYKQDICIMHINQ